MDLADRSVILVTLDSCRYDTARGATTANLDQLGPLLRAETSGTYTLPAHTAFFTGNVPRPIDRGYPIGATELTAIWRSAAARPTAGAVGIELAGGTLMDHYRKAGHAIIGAGGVTFFDPAEPYNSMPRLFDQFHYFGRPNRDAAGRASRLQDRRATLTLSHVTKLAGICLRHDRFFLFINCASTHVPYTTPDMVLTVDIAALLGRLYRLHDGKRHDPAAFNPAEIGLLRGLQRQALEWADHQLGVLFAALTAREPLVLVCADHGEEFGDDDRYGHGHPHPSVTTVPLWCGVLTPPR